MGVGDHQLDAAQPAVRERTQKVGPEWLGFRCAHLHAEHVTAAVGVGADGDYGRHRDDPADLAHLQVGGVNPQVGPVALDRALQERLHALVDLGAQARDLALGDAAHAYCLHQVIDRARRDALHVGILNHRGEHLASSRCYTTSRDTARGSSERCVAMVRRYGRTVHACRVACRVIGRKEVARCAELGIDVFEADSVHVLVVPDGSVVTTCRNHELRKIRRSMGRHRGYH